jgi:outer membrane protein assembly factor BamB
MPEEYEKGPFRPERIEEQIDRLLQNDHARSLEGQMSHELKALYTRDALSLDTIWQRLGLANEDEKKQDACSEEDAQIIDIGSRRTPSNGVGQPQAQFERKSPMQEKTRPERPFVRRLNTLIAALITILLVASLLFTFKVLRPGPSGQTGSGSHKSDPSATVPTASATPLPAPSTYVDIDGALYIINYGGLSQLGTDGSRRWTYQPETHPQAGSKMPSGYMLTTTLAVGRGVVYVTGASTIVNNNGTSQENALFGIDEETGRLLWQLPLTAAADSMQYLFATGSPDRDMLYIALNSGKLLAVNPSNGILRWSKNFSASKIITLNQGVIYLQNFSGPLELVAVRASDGQQIWDTKPAGLQIEPRSASFVNNTIYVSAPSAAFGQGLNSAPYYVVAYDARNGAQIWKSSPINSTIQSSPTVDNGLLYVGADNGQIYALNASNGTFKWQTGASNSVEDPIYIVGTTLVVGTTGGQIMAYDATSGGKVLWSKLAPGFAGTSGSEFYVSPRAGKIYYASETTGSINVLDATSGDLLRQTPIPADVQGYGPYIALFF